SIIADPRAGADGGAAGGARQDRAVTRDSEQAGPRPDWPLAAPRGGGGGPHPPPPRQRKSARDSRATAETLRILEQHAARQHNVMPALVEAARAGATVGEMSDAFRAVFGEFSEPSPW